MYGAWKDGYEIIFVYKKQFYVRGLRWLIQKYRRIYKVVLYKGPENIRGYINQFAAVTKGWVFKNWYDIFGVSAFYQYSLVVLLQT